MRYLSNTRCRRVLFMLLAASLGLPSAAQVAPRTRTKPAVDRLELRSYEDYVRAVESRDPDVREAAMVRMQRTYQILDDAMLERVLKAADDPTTPPGGVAAAATTLCDRGPEYFEKMTAQVVGADPVAAAQARRILAFAAHASGPSGAQPGNLSDYLPNSAQAVTGGEFMRQAVARGDDKVIELYIQTYGRGSQPARRIGPVSFRAAKASANRKAAVFRSNLQAEEAAVQASPNVNWGATGPGPSGTPTTGGSSVRPLLVVLTMAVIAIAVMFILPYLIVRPHAPAPGA